MHTTRGDDEKLRLFERKVLRKMYGPVFNNTEQKWEIRTNAQLYQLYKREEVVQFTRGTRVEWAGRWKFVERSIDIYGKGKKTKGKTAEKMEGQSRGIIGGHWSGLGAGI